MKAKMIVVLFALFAMAVPLTLAEQTAQICPVSGDKANPEVTYVHEGKTYAFCCKGCINKFKKDPEKYLAEHDGHAR